MMKNKIVTWVFLGLLFVLSVANFVKPDEALSFSERRRLAQLPDITVKSIMDGKAMSTFDVYALEIGRAHV